MIIQRLFAGLVTASLLAISPSTVNAAALGFFALNQSNPAINPEGDGVEVRVALTNRLQGFDAGELLRELPHPIEPGTEWRMEVASETRQPLLSLRIVAELFHE